VTQKNMNNFLPLLFVRCFHCAKLTLLMTLTLMWSTCLIFWNVVYTRHVLSTYCYRYLWCFYCAQMWHGDQILCPIC